MLEHGMVGIAERGPIGAATLSLSFAEWRKQHGNYTANNRDVVAAVQGFFDNGGTRLRFGRVVHFSSLGDPTTKTSAAGTLTLKTAAAAATSGQVVSSAQPFNTEPSRTLVVAIDAFGDVTVTFTATSATRESGNAENYNLADGQTLTIKIDGGGVLTKIFSASEFINVATATAEEIAASLNAFFASQGAGAVATATSGGTKVTITSNKRGTGSHVQVTGGTANAAIGFNTGQFDGTGNVADIDAVTAAELTTILGNVGGNATVTNLGTTVRIRSNTTGVNSKVQVKGASTALADFGFDSAIHAGYSGAAIDTCKVDGKTDGAYANNLSVVVAAATNGVGTFFNLSVVKNGVTLERFLNVTMDDADPRYIETVINDPDGGSDYIVVTDLDATPVDYPATGTFGPLTGGNDGLSSLSDNDYIGGESANGSTGFRLFDANNIDVLTAPGRATSAVHNAMITYCEVTRTGLCFAVMDPPASQTAEQMVTYVKTTAALKNLSEFGAIYWPRVQVVNPDTVLYGTAATVVVPPSGHIVGIMARNDARKIGGSFEQPAGVDFGVPLNVIGFETDAVKKKTKRELLFPENINPISQEPGTPIFVDGARTLKSTGNFSSIGQRRGVSFVEKRLIPGLAFMRHRNIKDKLYREGERTINSFLLDLTLNDCFKSKDPKKAFFVDLGPGLNTPSVQATKTVVARIGLATSEPAEFIVLLVGPDTRALDEELAALAAA